MYDFIVKKSSGFDGIESMSPKEGFVDFLSKFFDDSVFWFWVWRNGIFGF